MTLSIPFDSLYGLLEYFFVVPVFLVTIGDDYDNAIMIMNDVFFFSCRTLSTVDCRSHLQSYEHDLLRASFLHSHCASGRASN